MIGHSNIFFFRRFLSIASRPAPRKRARPPATVVADGGSVATPTHIQADRSLTTGPGTEHGELAPRQTLRRPLQTGAGSPVTHSSETENPGIGFVSQPRVQAPKLASFRIPPRPRYAANPRLSRKCRSVCAPQSGDCHQFPPLELAGCTRFALRLILCQSCPLFSSPRMRSFLITRLTPGFRRSLPETGCLSQGLPHGTRCA